MISSYDEKIKLLTEVTKREKEKLAKLKQLISKNNDDKELNKREILKNYRDAKSYLVSSSCLVASDDIRMDIESLVKSKQLVIDKREQLDQLQKLLKEFDGLEPTNEALNTKIEDLKKSRLSLEMSFLDTTLVDVAGSGGGSNICDEASEKTGRGGAGGVTAHLLP